MCSVVLCAKCGRPPGAGAASTPIRCCGTTRPTSSAGARGEEAPGGPRGGCGATLNIAGQHYECDTECVDFDGNPVAGHDGWAHGNRDARALWTCNQEDRPTRLALLLGPESASVPGQE